MKGRRLLFSSIMALGLSLGLLWLLDSASNVARADPGPRYVTTDGVDSGNCDSDLPCRTVQYAIDQASQFDEIWVAGGSYTDTAGTVATIITTVMLLGGWDDGFAVRDPETYTTTLDARGQGRVVHIDGSISPTIDGFTITGGNAHSEMSGTAGKGAGVYSLDANPIIQNNFIFSNVASVGGIIGYGGGIYLDNAGATAVISGNRVVSNTASTGGIGDGGGLYLEDSDVTVRDNLIMSNTASFRGGGIAVWLCSPHLVGNEIIANVAGGNGGGVNLYYSSAVIEGNLILGNMAGGNGGGIIHGGGNPNPGSPTIIANRIFSNSAVSSGGIGLSTSDYFTVANNLIAHNGNGGIKLWEHTRYGLIANNTFAFNTGGDGSIYLRYDNITPTIVNNIVVSNSYGIMAAANASGTLDYNDVWGNTTQDYSLPGALEPGPNDIQANPLFVDAASDDYHLRAGSPCIGEGTDAGVDDDIDGEARMENPAIGADEFITYVHLPLALKNY